MRGRLRTGLSAGESLRVERSDVDLKTLAEVVQLLLSLIVRQLGMG